MLGFRHPKCSFCSNCSMNLEVRAFNDESIVGIDPDADRCFFGLLDYRLRHDEWAGLRKFRGFRLRRGRERHNRGDSQFDVVGRFFERVRQRNQRLSKTIHPLCDQFRVEQLMLSEPVHAVENERFDRCRLAPSRRQAQQCVMVGRPGAGWQSEPRPHEIVVHAGLGEWE